MKRIAFVAALLGVGALAQAPSRDAYRTAYRAWREAEPNLERESATLDRSIATRANHAAAAAAKYGSARSAFLSKLAEAPDQDALWLQPGHITAVRNLAPANDGANFAATATAAVNAELAGFRNNSDRGSQQLRQALRQEQEALSSLKSAIGARQNAEGQAAKALAAIEPARAEALERYKPVAAALSESADSIKKESQSWTLYYAKLSGAAKGVTSGVTPPVTGAAPTSVTAPRVSVRAPVGPPSITPLPLIRYTGGWVFPPLGGMFHGPQPDSIDLEVSQSNNHVTGTFYGKFKLPRESKQDPVVRFDFSGDFQPNRNQAFRIRAPDGSTGTVELIPGNAFNLLEVNFQMGAQPGQPEKIRAADVLLVKK